MMDLSQYTVKIREDFSMLLCPNAMVKIPPIHKPNDRDYSNSADKGFRISPVAKRKIRSAAIGLYCNATRSQQLNLRFVTFTFPKLPNWLEAASKQQQDDYLHRIWCKFIGNERKEHNIGVGQTKVRLEKYLWVNERQMGEHIKDGRAARGVIHYHCLFRYTGNVDYWFANVRFLNLLMREGFDIFNQAFLAPQHQQLRSTVVQYLRDLNYKELFIMHTKGMLRIKVFKPAKGLVDESIFLQPVDFDKEPINDVTALSKYLSAYISKDYTVKDEYNMFLSAEQNEAANEQRRKDDPNKIFCRRWGCSQKLVTQKQQVEAAFLNSFPQVVRPASEEVDYSTGEVTEREAIVSLDKDKVFALYNLAPETFKTEFEVEVMGVKHALVYYPPTFELWSNVPEIREFFKAGFNFKI